MVVDAPTAVVQCLSSVLDGRHRWRALGIPQIRSELICGVQLVDAFRHSTGVECDAVRAAAKNRIAAARLSTVLDLSDGGAGSPMETVLRLLVLECLPPGYRWVSQLDLGRGRWGGTAPDLACAELKIALYYDGASHDSPDVRARDKAIDRQLESEGWQVLRFNRADIGVASVRRAVRAAVQVALDLLRMPRGGVLTLVPGHSPSSHPGTAGTFPVPLVPGCPPGERSTQTPTGPCRAPGAHRGRTHRPTCRGRRLQRRDRRPR